MNYNVASLFAGIGGIDKGFENAGFKTVWANDIDIYCEMTFKRNHKNTELVIRDIHDISINDIPYSIDVLAGGFPCQPFSIAGNRKGFDDDRGGLFFQIVRLLEQLKENRALPKVVFLENVKNLLKHDSSRTYNRMVKELEMLGYSVVSKVMNTAEYGNLPQNRERLFIIGFLGDKYANNFNWPEKIKLSNTIDKIIDWDLEVDSKYYYDDKSLIYPILKEKVKEKNVVYQYRRVYVRENKMGIAPTLTANMGMGGHNVPIILDSKNRIRKLTPKECLKLQGFDDDFSLPEKVADSRIYKQAGNSVSIPVIQRIASKIMHALIIGDRLNENDKV